MKNHTSTHRWNLDGYELEFDLDAFGPMPVDVELKKYSDWVSSLTLDDYIARCKLPALPEGPEHRTRQHDREMFLEHYSRVLRAAHEQHVPPFVLAGQLALWEQDWAKNGTCASTARPTTPEAFQHVRLTVEPSSEGLNVNVKAYEADGLEHHGDRCEIADVLRSIEEIIENTLEYDWDLRSWVAWEPAVSLRYWSDVDVDDASCNDIPALGEALEDAGWNVRVYD